MHRGVITHVVCTKTDFIITASHDGHIKLWKKIEGGVEFVKHFRSHPEVTESIAVSSEGALFCSVVITGCPQHQGPQAQGPSCLLSL